MQDLTAKRTLVKSPPELWSELSEVERLARHLGAFGEIKITRLEPERTVAWEGEGASGTVSIEPSGWGTKVTLTAQIEGEEPPPPEPEPEPEPPAPEPPVEPASKGVPEETGRIVPELPEPPRRKRRLLGWLLGREAREPAAAPEAERPVWVTGAVPEQPAAQEPAPPEPEPVVAEEPSEPVAERDTEPTPEPAAADNGAALNRDGAQAALESALEALGSAHHRPFSRG